MKKEDIPSGVWEIIKVLYLSDYYKDSSSIVSKIKDIFIIYPTSDLIDEAVESENWSRYDYDDVSGEQSRRHIKEVLSCMGMDINMRLKYLVRGIRCIEGIEKLIESVQRRLNVSNLTEKTQERLQRELNALHKTHFPGIKAMIASQDLIARMTGELSPARVKHLDGGTGSRTESRPHSKPVDELTEEELKVEVSRYEKLGLYKIKETFEQYEERGEDGLAQ